HQQKLGLNSSNTSPATSSIKQRRSITTTPKSRQLQLAYVSNDENQLYDKANISFVDEDSAELIEPNQKTDEN
ncbi:unnamed protein product, partial [Rotaria sordida]